MEPVIPAELSMSQRADLVDRIRQRPHDFVAQECLELSTGPVLEGDKFVARQLVMRTYLATQLGGGFVVMPGGLTRVSATADTTVVSMQRGGGSKDTWVLSNAEVSDFSLLPAGGFRVPLTRSSGDLPSRVADNLFWLGRYAERAEGVTRLLRGIIVRLSERPGLAECPELPVLFQALAAQAHPTWPRATTVVDPLDRVVPTIFDRADPNSLASVVESLRLVASVVV